MIAAIPAYNEERHIAEVVSKTLRHVDRVCVIDDGSSDGTEEAARAAGAEVIRHQTNLGKGEAVNTAFNLDREIHPQVMVLLDGDNQHDPDEIPALINSVLKNKCDMVVGSRFLRRKKISAHRMLGEDFASLIIV